MNKAFFVGLLLIFISIFFVIQVSAQTKNKLANAEPIHISPDFVSPFSAEKPLRIIIPSVHIDVPIVSAAIVDGHWEVSETFANHGQGSVGPGQSGNMVIFAHARPHLFLDLQNMYVGNEIYVLTDEKWYAYTVSEITQVTPEQVEVIAPTNDERVTLFTCSGYADEHRFIVVGKRNTKAAFGLDESFTNLLE